MIFFGTICSTSLLYWLVQCFVDWCANFTDIILVQSQCSSEEMEKLQRATIELWTHAGGY